jgi:hypothetical protein
LSANRSTVLAPVATVTSSAAPSPSPPTPVASIAHVRGGDVLVNPSPAPLLAEELDEHPVEDQGSALVK